MDLAYLQREISGALFGVLNFNNLYFWEYWSQLPYFFKVFHIFNSIFLGPVLFTRRFNNHCSPLLSYHIMLDLNCEMNSVWEVVLFRILLFGKYFFGGVSVSGSLPPGKKTPFSDSAPKPINSVSDIIFLYIIMLCKYHWAAE